MKHNEWDDCFLLHQRAHGETSLIVDVFTRTNGKISLIAKGAKKPKSKVFWLSCTIYKIKNNFHRKIRTKNINQY